MFIKKAHRLSFGRCAWLNGNPYPCDMSYLFLIIGMKSIWWCKDKKGKEMIQYQKIGIL